MKYICIKCNKTFTYKGCIGKLKCPFCNGRSNIMTVEGYRKLKKNAG